MQTERNYHTILLSSKHPLACAAIHAQKNRNNYIRHLILDDIYCPEILRTLPDADEKKPDLSQYDSSPIYFSLAFNPDKDEEVIAKLASVPYIGGYIRDLIYYSIGEDPRKHDTPHSRSIAMKNLKYLPKNTK